jgi:hypothetical protein
LVDEKVAAGMDPQAARRAAQLEMGGTEQVKEEVRAIRKGPARRATAVHPMLALRHELMMGCRQ